MPEVDAAIPLRAAPPVFNPLETVGKVMNVQQGMLQNRLLGQQIGGKEALGRAITASTDANGVTDWQGGLGRLAADPRGAFAVPELAAAVQDRQLKQLGIDKAQLELSANRWAKVGDASGAMLADKEPLTRDGVIKHLVENLIGSGLFTDAQSAGQLAGFVKTLPTDDQGIRNALKNIYLQSNMTQDRIGSLLGSVSTINRGPETVMAQSSPLTGDVRVNAAIPMGVDPATASAPMSVYNPVTKQMEIRPRSQVVGTGEAGSGPAQPFAAGPALGVAEAENTAATQGAAQAQQWRLAADRVPDSQAALKNIRSTLDSFTPGPKANWTYAIGALAQQLGGKVVPSGVTEGVAGQEEFNKLATQFINQQVGALGGTGTDAKLESARHGTPNEFMSKEGIRNVTALMMGLNDATMVKNAAWQKWLDAGNSPGSAGKFQTAFNERYNPRVFQSVYMSDAQKANMLKGMTAPERERFQKDWVFAKKAGWLQ